jgi:hypothetical protein
MLHGVSNSSGEYGRKTIKKQGRQGDGTKISLSRLELFYCRAAFLEENTVATIGAPDVDVNLYLLFAPGALV